MRESISSRVMVDTSLEKITKVDEVVTGAVPTVIDSTPRAASWVRSLAEKEEAVAEARICTRRSENSAEDEAIGLMVIDGLTIVAFFLALGAGCG